MITPSSTSPGVAPLKGTRTVTMSKSKSGKTYVGMLMNNVENPDKNTAAINKLAATSLRQNQAIIPFIILLSYTCIR
jgi:hypothetical protein